MVLKYFAYAYHFLLGLLIAAISTVALLSGFSNLRLGSLPFPQSSLPVWLLVTGLLGIVLASSAFLGKYRALFLAYAALIFCLMTYGYWLSRYVFSGPSEAARAGWFTAGALLAVAGAFLQLQRPARSS